MHPTKAGLYIAQSKQQTLLIRFIGFFPYLELKDGYSLSDYIRGGNTMNKIDEGTKQLILSDPLNWIITPFIYQEDSDNIAEYKNDSAVELSKDELEWYEDTFIKMKRAGCKDHALIEIIRAKFGFTQLQGINMFNEMNRKLYDKNS